MSEIRIRPATPADDRDLARLDHDTWSPLHAVSPRREAAGPFFDARHSVTGVLVAQVHDRLVGYVRVAPATGLPSNAHVRQIQGLAVDEAARGRGVARALLAAACDWSAARGARRLTLRVLGHNVPARRLYESAGFTVEGVLPQEFLLDGGYVDDVLMGTALPHSPGGHQS